jgi:hypothetical protein
MAQMIPEYLPDHATEGERSVFAIFQSLPDEVLVFYEPIVKRRYPDFVIIHPGLGVLVVEVKGWRAGWLQDVTADEVRYLMAGQQRTDWHPIKQARQYQNRLMSLCQANPYARELLMKDGRFLFAFGSLAILTGASRIELDQRGWGALFPPSSTVCSDEWTQLRAASTQELGRSLSNAFDPAIPRRALNNTQVNLIRDILYPPPFPGGPTSPDPENALDSAEQLKRLDLNQERIARDMRHGHRVIYGVAGSGKTVILEWRARRLSEDDNRRILFLCFNIALADHLSKRLADKANIEVRSFGRWAMSQGAEPNTDPNQFGEGLLNKLGQGLGNAGTYDSILIDEGQDFSGSWFKCAVAALRDRTHSDLVIAYDVSQNLYGRPPINWSSVGVSIVGGAGGSRTQRLPVNYRNTYEIVASARTFVGVQGAGDAEVLPLDPASCIRRGPWPLAVRCANRSALIAQCATMISEIVEKGLAIDGRTIRARQDEIRVLYARSEGDLINQLRTALKDRGLGSIQLGTIHSCKGLQARVVVIVFADQLPSQFPDRNEAAERSLFYVAATRPEELLVVMYSHDTPYVNEFVANLDAARTQPLSS